MKIPPRANHEFMPLQANFLELPVFDPQYLEVLFVLDDASGPSIVAEIVQQFRDAAELLFTELETALAANDLPAAADRAHSLKGGTSQLGMPRLSGIAQIIELSAKEGRGDELTSLLAAARESYQAASNGIDAFLQRRRQLTNPESAAIPQ